MGEGRRQRIMSGMRPTGRLHLGHLLGALENWKALQARYDCFFSIVDWHALATAYRETEEIRGNIREIAVDYLSGGVDPARCTLYVQSHIPEIAELHLLFSMTVPVAWLERVPTYKEQLVQLAAEQAKKEGRVTVAPGSAGSAKIRADALGDIREEAARSLETDYIATYGFLGYPLLQIADIAIVKGEIVPVGRDQLPHLEFAREFVRRFHHIIKREIFPEPQARLTETPLVPGIDGRKMSKSYGNSILISDPPEELARKAKMTITDPRKIRRGDPGHPEICNIFFYHTVANKSEVPEIEANCKSGALGCVDCKKNLAAKMSEFLAPIQARRAALERKPGDLDDILAEGARKVRTIAEETLKEVYEAMRMPRGVGSR